jgi:hypothetical protein
MAKETEKTLHRFRVMIRYIIIGTFPFGLLFSLPYPLATPYYRGSSPSLAPAIGLIVLFVSAILAIVDTGLLKRIKDYFKRTKYEYHIALPTDQKDKTSHVSRKAWLLAVMCADLVLLDSIAIILAFTMIDLHMVAMLVVYASLPYFVVG